MHLSMTISSHSYNPYNLFSMFIIIVYSPFVLNDIKPSSSYFVYNSSLHWSRVFVKYFTFVIMWLCSLFVPFCIKSLAWKRDKTSSVYYALQGFRVRSTSIICIVTYWGRGGGEEVYLYLSRSLCYLRVSCPASEKFFEVAYLFKRA